MTSPHYIAPKHRLYSISICFSEIVSIVVSIRVDKFYDKKIVWDRGLADKESESYQTLAYEANRAVSLDYLFKLFS